MQACITLDWLQLYCDTPPLYDKGVRGDYEYKKEEYQTRHFKCIHTVTYKGEECAVIASQPHSYILNGTMCLLKFTNKFLYQVDLYLFVTDFISSFDMEFRSISRLDIALDFTTFKNGLYPENLIKNFLSAKYIKSGKSKGKVQFEQGDKLSYSYLKFGSETSTTSYYLYNKTKELNEVKMKPYIVEHWRSNGYDGETTVWRLEFSVKNDGKDFLEQNSAEVFSLKDLQIIQLHRYPHLFWLLVEKYFRFYHNKNKAVKSRNVPVKLFDAQDYSTIKINLSDKVDSNRSDKIFVKKLLKLNQELRGQDFNLSLYGNDLLSYLICNRDLLKWASKKLDFSELSTDYLEKNVGKTRKELLLEIHRKK